MSQMLRVFVVFVLSKMALANPELAFRGGTCRPCEDGSFALTLNGKSVTLEGVYISEGWGFYRQRACGTAEVKDDKLLVTFTPPPLPSFKLREGQSFTVRLLGTEPDAANGLYRLGGTVGSFDRGSCWGWGEQVELMPHQARITWKGAVSLSCWGHKDGSWNLRIPAPKPVTIAITGEKIAIKKPVDIVAQKREQYRRILVPPQEEGFDVTRMLAVVQDPKTTAADFARLEDFFDARSRLASFADRLRHKPEPDAVAQAAATRGYAALSAMDYAGVTNACAELDVRLKGAEKWMPMTAFNPCTWVKSFTQWGYMKHPDGVGVYEPTPWNLLWEDGFRFTVAQDKRVVAANPGNTASRYLETRYLEPMTDVHATRTWTETRWSLPDGKTITSSLLSPIIDVDGVETLSIGGLPSEPYRLEWVQPSGGYGFVQLIDAPAEAPEIVASVLMDFTKPPESGEAASRRFKGTSRSRGRQQIKPESVGRPWLRLRSKDGWSLAFLPGARPIAATWEKGVFQLTLENRSHVGVLRLRDNLHPQEQPAIMEFFARQSAAYPSACFESVEGTDASWRYTYRRRPNAWGDAIHPVAPVPPLAEFAGCSIPGLHKVKYPTKWGVFSYVEGTEIKTTLPGPSRSDRAPSESHRSQGSRSLRDGTNSCAASTQGSRSLRDGTLRGVNVSVFDSDEKWEEHRVHGAQWVRAFMGSSHARAEACAALEAKLAKFGPKGLRVLVDPHGLDYKVDWGTCARPEKDADYLALWDALSQVGARHPQAIAGYDLYNEPGLVAGAEARWQELNTQAAKVIRRNHSQAAIYYSAIYGGNPNGLFNLEPLPIEEPQITTFHFYTPHSFTHQKVSTHNAGGDTCVFYPGWAPEIDWTGGTHFGGTTVDWFDKWTLGAAMLPAFEYWAQYRQPLHCGEFSVIGYANAKSPYGAFLWTRDTVELLEHVGASWHLWNGGFGLSNPLVRDWLRNGCRSPLALR